MNADNWTELTSSYGATFRPAVAPERNVLAAAVELHQRTAAATAYADDAAAAADTALPSGAFYTITGSTALYRKP